MADDPGHGTNRRTKQQSECKNSFFGENIRIRTSAPLNFKKQRETADETKTDPRVIQNYSVHKIKSDSIQNRNRNRCKK